jgi:hypothetical protein
MVSLKDDSMSLAREILKQKKQELLAQAAEIRKGIRDLDAALEVLGEPETGKSAAIAGQSSPINAAILEAISHGNGTPESIYLFIRDQTSVETTKNSISTRLSKLKNDGLIDHDGQGWVLANKAEGSDAPTSEPSDKSGPVGRERGYPPSAPEGSTPSGSTASYDLGDILGEKLRERSLDDEIPF